MPTNTYVALDKVTVGTATNSITFTSIPSTYTDLIIVANVIGFSTGGNIFGMRFNGDTANNYSGTAVIGTGSAAQSSRYSTIGAAPIGGQNNGTGTGQATVTASIQNYSNTTTFKTVLSRFSSSTQQAEADVALWRSTAAINSVEVYVFGGGTTMSTGSTFSLYGIAAEGITAKATGGAIYADSTYWYHVFSSTGTFTPLSSLTADVLVVAGGGSGGSSGGGGGGAGGVIYFESQSLTATGYTCTVGGGGARAQAANDGSSGTNSSFGALTAAVGGGGSNSFQITGGAQSGGSGGGAAAKVTGTTAGGSSTQTGTGATAFYGNAGGSAATDNATYRASGGGGGAGQAGTNGTSGTLAGAGGNGISTYSSWGTATGVGQNISGTYWIAGGGGGGQGPSSGGNGGGGAGAYGSGYSNGMANTGSGGGGQGGNTSNDFSGSGGSGVVVIRYAKV
jgi:hypothetical protein